MTRRMEGEAQERGGAGPGRRKRPPTASTPPPPLRACPVRSGSSSGLSRNLPLRGGQAPPHFKEESISLCHPERTAGPLAGQGSCAALSTTLLTRFRLTRTSSYLKCSGGASARPPHLFVHPDP